MINNAKLILRYLAVAEAGSIHAAAHILNLSQPALTKSIHSLEENLGTKLLERHSKGVRPTPNGDILIHYAKNIRDALNLAKMELQSISATGTIGRLHIGAGTVWATSILPKILPQLQLEFPSLVIDVEMSVNPSMLPKLANSQLDMVFAAREEEQLLPSHISYEPMTSISHQLVCSTDHPIMNLETITPDMIFEFPFVIYRNDQKNVQNLLQNLATISNSRIKIAIWSQSYAFTVKLLQSGEYLSCLACSDDLPLTLLERGLRIPPIELPLQKLESGVFYRSILKNAPPVQRMFELSRNICTSLSPSAFSL